MSCYYIQWDLNRYTYSVRNHCISNGGFLSLTDRYAFALTITKLTIRNYLVLLLIPQKSVFASLQSVVSMPSSRCQHLVQMKEKAQNFLFDDSLSSLRLSFRACFPRTSRTFYCLSVSTPDILLKWYSQIIFFLLFL